MSLAALKEILKSDATSSFNRMQSLLLKQLGSELYLRQRTEGSNQCALNKHIEYDSNVYLTDDKELLKDLIGNRVQKFGRFGDLTDLWQHAKIRIANDHHGEMWLLINELEVMSSFEIPYMFELAREVSQNGGRILNIGFGLGYIDSLIEDQRNFQAQGEGFEHHIIELNEDVYHMALRWRDNEPSRDKIFIHKGNWKSVIQEFARTGTRFDGINYDAYPLKIGDISRDSVDFIGAICDLGLLRQQDGILTFYTDSPFGFGERFRQLIALLGFSRSTTRLVPIQLPKQGAEYWKHDHFVVPTLTGWHPRR